MAPGSSVLLVVPRQLTTGKTPRCHSGGALRKSVPCARATRDVTWTTRGKGRNVERPVKRRRALRGRDLPRNSRTCLRALDLALRIATLQGHVSFICPMRHMHKKPGESGASLDPEPRNAVGSTHTSSSMYTFHEWAVLCQQLVLAVAARRGGLRR